MPFFVVTVTSVIVTLHNKTGIFEDCDILCLPRDMAGEFVDGAGESATNHSGKVSQRSNTKRSGNVFFFFILSMM